MYKKTRITISVGIMMSVRSDRKAPKKATLKATMKFFKHNMSLNRGNEWKNCLL